MANTLKLNTKDESFREIFANGKQYFVPRFQRDYSWELEHWQDLWEDIQLLHSKQEEYHYMGYLVLQESSQNMRFKIIDGQQRLTTFSLLVLAAVKRLRKMEDEDARITGLLNNFIGSEDLVHLRRENKLALNRNNEYWYKEAVNERELPRVGKNTVLAMKKALDYFFDCFGKLSTAVEISTLIKETAQRMLFTTIYIGDDLNAYKVFETLNARGVKLSSADLLKNYLFSLVDPNNDTPDKILDESDAKWEQIGVDIGNRNYTEYLLVQWNSAHALTRQSELFKKIKITIKDKKMAKSYLDTLAENSQLFFAVVHPEGDFWIDLPQHTAIKNSLHFLALFGIRQPRSLLMASYVHFKSEFYKIAQWIQVFSLRYNVICGMHPGEQEKLYNAICIQIEKGCAPTDIKVRLLDMYPDDKKFQQDFSGKTLPTRQSNKRARYLLTRLAEYGGAKEGINESSLTVEHVLPLNPNEEWRDYFGESHSLFNQRLGNMALVDGTQNRALNQRQFVAKKEILLHSAYQINYTVAEYEQWDTQAIASRQETLAHIAAQLWRID